MASRLRIVGGTPLRGQITVRGAKNLVPKAMVAALLAPRTSTLRNVPLIRDVDVVSDLLRMHGVTVDYDQEAGVLDITPGRIHLPSDPVEMDRLAGSSRIPILFAGPLLHNLGEAFIPDLGGCHIGDRPVDFHIRVLEDFGAVRVPGRGGMHLVAKKGLKAKPVHLPYPSVGATEQTLLAAVRAEGITELTNAAIEPEIMDLIAVLQKMGAIISVETDRTIKIEGVESLRSYSHTALPDRIEAGSWACAALATRGDIFVRGAQQQTMTSFLNVFRKVGGEFGVADDGIRFWHPGGTLRAMALQTDVHPGFMTDWQQPLVVALTQATGISIVHETVYENRRDPDVPRMPGRPAVSIRPAQLLPLGCHPRPRQAPLGRHRSPRPEGRVLASHRRARGRGDLARLRDRHHRPRIRAFHAEAPGPGSRRRQGVVNRWAGSVRPSSCASSRRWPSGP